MIPTLSICIPTFNRAKYLDNLLYNLEGIISDHGSTVEICISNNHSTDNTADVIEKWRVKLALKVTTQLVNIGGTMNFIAVSGMATGKWFMLIGDDDCFNLVNFKKLMDLLRSSIEPDWVLVGVEDNSNKEKLIGDILTGRYDASSFKKKVLRTGLYNYGFIGMHVFPAIVLPKFKDLAQQQDVLTKKQPWPHIYLFLNYIQSAHIRIFSPAVVKQAANGSQLFWTIGDWCYVNLIKLDTIVAVRNKMGGHYWFFNALLMRELYSLRSIKELILWKLLDPEDFSKRALFEVFSRYKLVGTLIPLAIVHWLLFIILLWMPHFFLRKVFKVIGKEDIVNKYNIQKKHNNALLRGI